MFEDFVCGVSQDTQSLGSSQNSLCMVNGRRSSRAALLATSMMSAALLGLVLAVAIGQPAYSAQGAAYDEDSLRETAERGDSVAQFSLGRQHEARRTGDGIVQAYVWYNLAARGGHPQASLARDRIGAGLSAVEFAQAQRQIIDLHRGMAQSQSEARARKATDLVGTASGFAVDRRGHVVTSYRAVRGCWRINVVGNSFSTMARVKAASVSRDLAVLATGSPLTPADFRAVGELPSEGSAVAISSLGRRGEIATRVTTGELASHDGPTGDWRMVELDIAAGPLHRGAPVLDQSGNVIGLMVGGRSMELTQAGTGGGAVRGANYALKAAVIEDFLLKNGVAVRHQPSQTAGSGGVQAKAAEFTVRVECWR